jgi:hypothetical protein
VEAVAREPALGPQGRAVAPGALEEEAPVALGAVEKVQMAPQEAVVVVAAPPSPPRLSTTALEAPGVFTVVAVAAAAAAAAGWAAPSVAVVAQDNLAQAVLEPQVVQEACMGAEAAVGSA